MSEVFPLKLERLLDGIGSYSPRKCAFSYEAAVKCIHDAKHDVGVTCEVKDGTDLKFVAALYWDKSEIAEIKYSWNDHNELVKYGAEGISLLIIVDHTDYTVIGNSQIGTGVDFFLGDKNSVAELDGSDFPERKARLEVSGIFREVGRNTVKNRVTEKAKRLEDSVGNGTPAYILVVEFSQPTVDFSRL